MKKQLIILSAIVCSTLFLCGCLQPPHNKKDIENFYGDWRGQTSLGSISISIGFEPTGTYNYSKIGMHYEGTWHVDGEYLYMNDTKPFLINYIYKWSFLNNANMLILKNTKYDDKITLYRQG